ncbi:MAG: AgrD family cyclic lactone autoinducer peptide [Lachnospira sp.]
MKKTMVSAVKKILDSVLVVNANSSSSCFAFEEKTPKEIEKFKRIKK